MTTKSKIDIELFRNWKVKSLARIQEKIIKLKQKVKPKGAKSVLNSPEFKIYLEQLHCQFFIVAIDKASNNFACICKKYCMTKLLHEFSINGGTPNKTQYQALINKEEIVNVNDKYCKKLDIYVKGSGKTLAIM